MSYGFRFYLDTDGGFNLFKTDSPDAMRREVHAQMQRDATRVLIEYDARPSAFPYTRWTMVKGTLTGSMWPDRRSAVMGWMVIPNLPTTDAQEKAERECLQSVMREARRMIRGTDITIETDECGGYWVYCGKYETSQEEDPGDPFEGDHFANDADAVMVRVVRYLGEKS